MIWRDKKGNTHVLLNSVGAGEDLLHIVSALISLMEQDSDMTDMSLERYFAGYLLRDILPNEAQWDVILDDELENVELRKQQFM